MSILFQETLIEQARTSRASPEHQPFHLLRGRKRLLQQVIEMETREKEQQW